MSHPPSPPALLSDKGAHALVYAGLAFLLVRALGGRQWQRPSAGVVIAAVCGAALYGVSDEVHQAFVPSREADVRDLVADLGGGAVGAGAVYAWGIIAKFSTHRIGRS